MLKYNPKDQYHEVILNHMDIKFICEIIANYDTHIILKIIEPPKNLYILGTIEMSKSSIKQINPVMPANMKMYYIAANIYPSEIKGLGKLIEETQSSIEKIEYYKVQVPETSDNEYRDKRIRAYLSKYATYWGGFHIITEEDYEKQTAISEETRLIEQYGDSAQTILSLLKFLNVETRFQAAVASDLLDYSELFEVRLRRAIMGTR